MAEIALSILLRQYLKCRIPDAWILGAEILAWKLARDARKAAIDWSFSLDAAIRARFIYQDVRREVYYFT